MANSIPMWWMRGGSAVPPQDASVPPPDSGPPKQAFFSQELGDLTARLRHMDTETLLLLALLWLLYQEKADRKLLLALAYIAL